MDGTLNILNKDNKIIYPVTVSDGVINPYNGKILTQELIVKKYFEFGGIDTLNGNLVQNNIRIRTVPIYFEGTGTKNIKFNVPDNIIPAYVSSSSLYAAYSYLGAIPVKLIPDFSINNNVISFTADGSFDNIRVSFKHSDDSEISEQELSSCSIDLYGLNEEIEKLNKFSGLKYVALGDSITYGFIPRNYNGYPGQLQSYAAIAAHKLEMNFYNYGISGSTVAYHSTRNPMSVRYADMIDDADIITVMGGTNDVRNGILLGQMSDRDNTTFYGALHVLFQGLYTKYIGNAEPSIAKRRKIIVCTPIKLLDSDKSGLANTIENNANVLYKWDDWINAIKEVAAFYSFPVLDFYNLSGINPHLNRTLKGTEDGYTGYYNPYITDGTHPTQEAAEMMADLLVGYIKSIM